MASTDGPVILLISSHFARIAKVVGKRKAVKLVCQKPERGNHLRLTDNGAANFGPYFHPDGRRIIHSSNAGTGNDREFELFLIDKVPGETEQVTFSPGFDGFPQFSPNGEWFVWASNHADPDSRETNLFIARWRD